MNSMLPAILTVVTATVALVALCAGQMICFYKLLGRGYYWRSAFVLSVMISIMGVFLGGMSAGALAGGVPRAPLVSAFVGGLCSLGLASAAGILLPKWKQRIARFRGGWMRLRNSAYWLAAICGAFLAVTVMWHVFWRQIDDVLIAIDVLGVIVMIAGVLYGRSLTVRAQRGRHINDTVKADTRPPVLYLREFLKERQPVQMETEHTQTILLGMTTVREFNFEDYLTEAIETSLGPLVALGHPSDFLIPRGAARDYPGDDQWRERFMEVASSATAVVVLPGSSPGLSWELGWLLQKGLATKLFVILGPNALEPPIAPEAERPARRRFRWHKFTRWVRWAGILSRVDWEDFAKSMAVLGYQMPDQRPCLRASSVSMVMGGRMYSEALSERPVITSLRLKLSWRGELA